MLTSNSGKVMSYEKHDYCILCSRWFPKKDKHKPMVIDAENNVDMRDCAL